MDATREILAQNLERTRLRIKEASRIAGRATEEICLVAVTKGIHREWIGELHALGVRDIGENRVQEALEKALALPVTFTWHMVGHLQRNKVKKGVALFSWIHSVDSIPLAVEIDREARLLGKTVPVLIQVNTSGEKTKFGLSPNDLLRVLEGVSNLRNMQVKGLMTIAPLEEDEELCRPFFHSLRELRDQANRAGAYRDSLTELSMGMSQDFAAAVEEGSTMVRIGTLLFQGIHQPGGAG